MAGEGHSFTAQAHRRARGARAARRGLRAEALAAAYLHLLGWRILATRWRTPDGGEADILAERAGILAAVEVKARDDLEAAAVAVTPRAWARIAAAAEHFLAQGGHGLPADAALRFDLIAAAPRALSLLHMPRAWEGGLP
jgi:putative endonuclease